MATLAEKITAAKAALVEKKDALQAIANKMAALADGDSPDDEDQLKSDELAQQVERLVKDIDTMERTEAALAKMSRPAGTSQGGSPASASVAAPMIATAGHMQRKPDINLFVRSAMAAFESHETHYPIAEIIEQRWPGQGDLSEVAKLVTGIRKAAQAPAMTNVPEWAGSLVRETFAAFMELLQAESVIPRLNLTPLDFNGSSVIKVPYRMPAAVSGQSLTGAFRKEGDPIRVGAARMATKPLRAYTMGVIGTFTMEMLEASPINFEEAIKRWMIEDTAVTLDTAFLDATAEVAETRPAGLRNGLAAGDIHAKFGQRCSEHPGRYPCRRDRHDSQRSRPPPGVADEPAAVDRRRLGVELGG